MLQVERLHDCGCSKWFNCKRGLAKGPICFVLFLGLAGCASTSPNSPPPISTVDSNAGKTLYSVQLSIEQAKKDIATFPQFKDALNKVIAGYNTAEDAYQVFHKAVAAGGAPDPVALSQQVSQLMTDLGNLQASIAGVKK